MSKIDELKDLAAGAMKQMATALTDCNRANFCNDAYNNLIDVMGQLTGTLDSLEERERVARNLYHKQEARIIELNQALEERATHTRNQETRIIDLNHSLIQREAQIQALTNQSDDWVVLPRKATPTMLAEIELVTGWTAKALAIRYTAMVNAAPKLEGIKAERPEPMAYLVWCHAGYGPDNYYDAIEVGSKDDLNCDGSPAWPVWSYPPISIPLGWKLVPKKITEEMRHAFNKAFDEHEEGILDVIFPDHGWDAMLEVSPTADVLIVEDVK